MSSNPQPSIQFVNAHSLTDPQFYSHAVSINGGNRLIYTSGQLGTQQDGSIPDEFLAEVQQAFDNLSSALQSAGAQTRDVIKLTFYCANWSWDKLEEWLQPTLGFMVDGFGCTIKPLTTLVFVNSLAMPLARFEVEAVAAVGGQEEIWTNPTSKGVEFQVGTPKVDVVVVGGGFSGLQAAYDLQQAGLSCIVLEAKHRIGGRSCSQKLRSGEGTIELGATWINKTTQPKAYDLTQKFNLDCLPQYTEGDSIWQMANGTVLRIKSGTMPQAPGLTESEFLGFIHLLETTAASTDLHNHETFGSDMSVEDWIAVQGLSEFMADFMRHFVRALVGGEAKDIGLHYILDYIKSGGGYQSLASEGEYGAQSLKIKQGTSAIAHGLANELKPGSIYINSPVATIEQFGDLCKVTTSNGLAIDCGKVIMAIPTNTYDGIKFNPPLPQAKRAIVTRTKPGVYAKAILTYDTPWWRDIGLVGSFNSVVGPICFSWETSDKTTNQYSLALFIAGDIAAKWHQLSSLRREEAIISHLSTLIGKENAPLAEKGLVEVNIMEWTKEEFLGGAPTSSMGPGDLAKYGAAMRAPYKNLHFAGGEMAFEWKGYLEGALLAGSHAADEVIGLKRTAMNGHL